MEEYYQDIINPINFVKQFKSKQEFIEWLHIGTKSDIQSCLDVFTQYEMYEYCSIIKQELDKL